MSYLFKNFINDKIVEKHFKERYGKKYKLEMDMQYQFQYKSHTIDVGFTADKKAFWIFKYKNEYYMNIIEDITFKDKYMAIDIYITLTENAINSYKQITGLQKIRRKAKLK